MPSALALFGVAAAEVEEALAIVEEVASDGGRIGAKRRRRMAWHIIIFAMVRRTSKAEAKTPSFQKGCDSWCLSIIEQLARNFPENGMKLLLEEPQNVEELFRILKDKVLRRIDFRAPAAGADGLRAARLFAPGV